MRKHFLIIMSMVCFLVSGFYSSSLFPLDSGTDTGLDYLTKIGDNTSINWTTKVIKVKGYGVGSVKEKELGRRKLMAQRAAEMDAYRKLLETVKGVRVTSYIDVGEMMRKSHTISTKISGMLRGMRVVDVIYSSDGSCTVTVEVTIDKEGNFLLAILNNGGIKITDNYPKFDWIKARKDLEVAKAQLALSRLELDKTKKDLRKKEICEREKLIETSKNYTGLLVDASGVDLKPALAPSILNQKEEKMYGIGVIPDEFARGAIVSYLHGNIERAKKHKEIGNNPLVVKCVRSANKSDVIISDVDARKLVWIDKILKQKRVAILI